MTQRVVPFTHTVVVSIVTGWRGKPLITMGLLKLLSSGRLVLTGELTQTVISYAHAVVVFVGKGGQGGGEGTNDEHGALKLFSKSWGRGINKKSG